jgi:nitroreductase
VSRAELERIASVCCRIPSARNQQVLRMRLVTHDSGADQVLPLVKMGAALPELHLPFPGTEPEAFIVVCSTVKENPMVDIDLGIAAQSMLLKAVEMGLNGLIIAAFNRAKLQEALALPYLPLLVIAIGKGDERIELTPIGEGKSHAYYRRDGVHYVPKVRAAELII